MYDSVTTYTLWGNLIEINVLYLFNYTHTMEELKEEIMHTILINGNNIDELVDVLKWALHKAEALQDMQNECELNALENSSNEC